MDYPDGFWIIHWFKVQQKRPVLHQALVKFRTTWHEWQGVSDAFRAVLTRYEL
jgi:hypothetical protein